MKQERFSLHLDYDGKKFTIETDTYCPLARVLDAYEVISGEIFRILYKCHKVTGVSKKEIWETLWEKLIETYENYEET